MYVYNRIYVYIYVYIYTYMNMICTHTSACVVYVCFCHHACRGVYLYVSLWTWYIDIHHMRVLNLLYSFRPWHPWVWLQVPIYPSIKWEKCLASQMIAIIEMWSRDKQIHTIFFWHFGFMGFHGAAYLPRLWHKCVYNERSFLSDQFGFFFWLNLRYSSKMNPEYKVFEKQLAPWWILLPKRIGFLKGSEIDFGRNRTKKSYVLFFFLNENINFNTTNNKQTTNQRTNEKPTNGAEQRKTTPFWSNGTTALCRLSASRGGELLGSIDDVPPFSRAKWSLDFGGKKFTQNRRGKGKVSKGHFFLKTWSRGARRDIGTDICVFSCFFYFIFLIEGRDTCWTELPPFCFCGFLFTRLLVVSWIFWSCQMISSFSRWWWLVTVPPSWCISQTELRDFTKVPSSTVLFPPRQTEQCTPKRGSWIGTSYHKRGRHCYWEGCRIQEISPQTYYEYL